MSYAIISLGGKQYRVREGERLLVDRLAVEEGKTFHPDVLMLGGEGKFELAPKSVQVTARVVGSPLGRFLLWAIPGSAAFAFAFAGIGWAVGSNYKHFHHLFDIALEAGAALVVLYLVVRLASSRLKRRA